MLESAELAVRETKFLTVADVALVGDLARWGPMGTHRRCRCRIDGGGGVVVVAVAVDEV